MGRKKRPRGGQPGNQNARKHGFYAANLSRQETNEFYTLLSQNGSEPELAVIRMKLGFVLRHAPGNRRLLREVTGLLNKYCRSNFDLDRCNSEDQSAVRQFIRDFKTAVINKNYTLPEPTEAKS